jgi:hypothetical protein
MFNPEMFAVQRPFWEDEEVAKRYLLHDRAPEVAHAAFRVLPPLILIFILRLINDRRLVNDLANGPVYNALAWLTACVVIFLVAVLLTNTALGAFGLDLFDLISGGS